MFEGVVGEVRVVKSGESRGRMVSSSRVARVTREVKGGEV